MYTYPAVITEGATYRLQFVDFPNVSVIARNENDLISKAMQALGKALIKKYKKRIDFPIPTNIEDIFPTHGFIGLFSVERNESGFKVSDAQTFKVKEVIDL